MNINTNEPITDIPFSKNEFLDTAFRTKMNAPTTYINYLDMSETKIRDDGMAQIGLNLNRQTITSKNYQVSATYDKQNSENLKLFGINTDDQMQSVLINEANMNIEKTLKEQYSELGISMEKSDWSKWKTFLNKQFGIEFPEYVKDPKDLINKLFLYSNLIAVKTRRGPANFIVVPPSIAAFIAEDPRVILNSIGNSINHGVTPFATIADKLKVFVDPSSKYEDGTVIIGKTTSDGNPGVILGEYSRQMLKVDDISAMDFSQIEKYQLRDRLAITPIGNHPYGYYTKTFITGKKPIWRKIIFA